jgi:SAM-dependent methyltransferase
MKELDSASRAGELRQVILGKPSLKRLYDKFYEQYAACLARCPDSGIVVEIGSGAGLAKEMIPELVATDILPYATVDLCVDAMRLPFANGSLKAILLLNTLHHIPDIKLFFSEAQRCLVPNGRILIIDQYPGWLSYWIYKYLHHEPFVPDAEEWSFATTGPLSGANGALCWMVFFRDKSLFARMFKELRIYAVTPHTPFCYWLTGGLKSWSLLPESMFNLASSVDDSLSRILPQLSSFVSVELVRA